MRKSILVISIMVFAMFATVAAQPPMGMGMGKMHGMMLEKLKLSDEQWEKMQNLKFKLEKELITKKADLKMAKLNLEEIMMKPEIDERAAINQMDKISSLKAQIEKLKFQHLLDARKILTPDQLKEFRNMHRGKNFNMRMGGPEGMGGMPMMGCGMGPMGHGMGQGMGQGMHPGMNPGGDDQKESEEGK